MSPWELPWVSPLGVSLGASLPPQGGTAQEPLTTWTTLLLRIPLRTVPMQDSLKDILGQKGCRRGVCFAAEEVQEGHLLCGRRGTGGSKFPFVKER